MRTLKGIDVSSEVVQPRLTLREAKSICAALHHHSHHLTYPEDAEGLRVLARRIRSQVKVRMQKLARRANSELNEAAT